MKVYTDGSARPTNPGAGRSAIVVCDDQDNILYTLSKSFDYTTNNRAEMFAVLVSLQMFGKREEEVTVYCDSAYTINSFTVWMPSWKSRGWKKADNVTTPENLDILMAYDKLLKKGYHINLVKVKGHSNCRGNQLADEIASGKRKAKINL